MSHVSRAVSSLRLLRCTEAGGELVPRYVSDRDRPWLRDLVEFAHAADGRPFAELATSIAILPPDPRALDGYALARQVLLDLLRPKPLRDARRAALRRDYFARAEDLGAEAARTAIEAEFDVAADGFAHALFADLPSRAVVVWPSDLTAERLALAVNRAIARAALASAVSARIRIVGASRTVLRTAWLLGGGLVVHDAARRPLDGVVFDWRVGDGFGRAARRRALLGLLPVLPWTRRFSLDAWCDCGGEPLRLRLSSLDPLLPGPEPRAFDSALEASLVRDLVRIASGLEVVREPAPLVVGTALAFPDFAVRWPGGEPWFVEIAGLRDAAALPAKLALLLASERLVLCLPQRVAATLPMHPRVVAFARRVDAAGLLRRLRALDERGSR